MQDARPLDGHVSLDHWTDFKRGQSLSKMLEKYLSAVKGVHLLQSSAVAVSTSEFVLKTLEVIQQFMIDPQRYGLEKLMYFNEVGCCLKEIFKKNNNIATVGWRLQYTRKHFDELVDWFSRFCVIHLEGYVISDGEVESDLIGL